MHEDDQIPNDDRHSRTSWPSGQARTCDSLALMPRLIELAEDGIISCTIQQEILLFNRGAEKIFGYSAQEVLGQSLEMLLPVRYRAAHQEHLNSFGRGAIVARRMGERSEVLGLRKDGVEFPAEVSISRQEWEGQLIFTAVVRDITERKHAEQEIRQLNQMLEQRVMERTRELEARTEELRDMSRQLWQAAKLASVGEVAAGIAHELNNPLATVSLRVESVLNKLAPGDPSRKALEIVDQEVRRMSSLIANLLQFSRRSQDQFSLLDPRDELTKTIELVQYLLTKRSIRVVLRFDANVPRLYADRQKVRQVFLNLLTNAADAMPRGGELTLTLAPAALDDGKPALRIEVNDTGIGIEASDLARVFEPFFTTKEEGKGTGLGLPICKRIVQEHGGTLEISSTVGIGTRVCIVLPAATVVESRRLTGKTK